MTFVTFSEVLTICTHTSYTSNQLKQNIVSSSKHIFEDQENNEALEKTMEK